MAALPEATSVLSYFDCRQIAQDTRTALKTQIADLNPGKIAVVQFGDNPGASSYRTQLMKDAKSLGLETQKVHKSPSSLRETQQLCSELSQDPSIGAIIPVRPIPEELLRQWKLTESVVFKSFENKDPDLRFPYGDGQRFPGVVEAARKIIENYNILPNLYFSLNGQTAHYQKVAIIGSNGTVGHNIRALLEDLQVPDSDIATIDIKTPDPESLLSQAALVFGCANNTGCYSLDLLRPDAYVIDPGWNFDQTQGLPDNFRGLITSNEKGMGIGPLASLCTFENYLLKCVADRGSQRLSRPYTHPFTSEILTLGA